MNLDDPQIQKIIPKAISAEEIKWNESHCPALRGDQKPEFCSIFENLEAIRGMGLNNAALIGVEREFWSASVWHSARARPALAEKYYRLAENLHKILVEKSELN